MAKLGKLSQENEDIIAQLVSEVGLDNYMTIKPISMSKAKQLIKVQKANQTAEYLGKCSDTVCIYVYEAAYDRLDDTMKVLLMRDAINMIQYDTEKDKIMIGAPQIVVTIGGRAKWGNDLINAAECGVLAIAQIEQEEKERKEQEKAKKSKKA